MAVKAITWNGPGTVYQMYRRSTPAGAFEYIGGSGVREYVDETIPAGASQLTYKVQAVRSTAAGPWATFNVNFGVGSGGGQTATLTETKAA